MIPRHDWTFEDVMYSLNCTVQAYDLTVDYPESRGEHTTFHKLGIAPKK